MSKYVDGINEERMDAFLSDLRSGDFEQGRSQLESPSGKMCCLGVACVRPAAEGVVKRTVSDYGSVYYGDTSVDMPYEVAEYLGIPCENRSAGNLEEGSDIYFLRSGFVPHTHQGRENTAIGYNDSKGRSFSEIAAAFEAEFLKEV